METMMSLNEGLFKAPGAGRAVAVFGVQVEFLVTCEESGGAYSAYRATAEPGIGAPLHVHQHEDENFYVAEGRFEIRCGERSFVGEPGAFVALPRGIAHSFTSIGPGRGVLIGFATPGGHERFFDDAGAMSFPPDPEEALAVCRRHGIELVPPAE